MNILHRPCKFHDMNYDRATRKSYYRILKRIKSKRKRKAIYKQIKRGENDNYKPK